MRNSELYDPLFTEILPNLGQQCSNPTPSSLMHLTWTFRVESFRTL